ncbi:hypothetical protein Tco_1291490 [Tanacetum coccineum]
MPETRQEIDCYWRFLEECFRRAVGGNPWCSVVVMTGGKRAVEEAAIVMAIDREGGGFFAESDCTWCGECMASVVTDAVWKMGPEVDSAAAGQRSVMENDDDGSGALVENFFRRPENAMEAPDF